MARRSTIEKLPEDVRRWLERALTESGFSGYNELESLLRERGTSSANPLSIAMDRRLSAAMVLSVRQQKRPAC
ncbi:hypothetical protein ECZU08_00060 [Escherichia coli]|nr:hypothetical protein ECZU08_00060 [Escherichia coli]STE62659.1 Mu-like phage-related protein [Escherichia coli]